jgi:phosphate starvation-inducible protein PhoH and related proteins
VSSANISTHTTVAHEVELSPSLVERLFSGVDPWIQQVEAAVRPFRLQASRRATGVQVGGDPAAVALASAVIRLLAETKPGRLEAPIAEVIETAVQNTLKHDLAFRLSGMPRAVRPMSVSQVAFMNAILSGERQLIFGVGPTGTGKTHLAVAAGLNLVAEQKCKTMIITRPRVMLEGEVMTPALRAETAYDEQLTPIEDVLHDLIGPDEIKRQIEHELIQIMPLGRMRGRSFNDAYVLVDEAQNMTVRKMRMALTRMGRNARMVVTGDPRQIDLPHEEPSGLLHILRLLAGTDLAHIHKFQNQEIVRNDLVARIEALYSREDSPEIRAAA